MTGRDPAVARARHIAPRTRLRALAREDAGIDWPVIAAAVDALYEGPWAMGDVEWAETIEPPSDPDEFGREVVFVILNSGMRFTVARGIFDRVMPALYGGASASTVFGHAGKAAGIDRVWRDRAGLLEAFLAAEDRLAWCETLPWVGPITKYHLAKNFAVPCAKPDVHLMRLARLYATTPQALCERIAAVSGWRIPTVDTLLWRACATGILCGHTGVLLRRGA